MNLDRHNSDIVLIVDDVPDNLSMLHDALDEFGYTVLVATNGEQALQRAAQAMPDVILLDAVMPGMDGFEVAKRLKADAATAAIPVIFMTGLTETEHVLKAFQSGGVDYVAKPIKPMEVLARIAAHVQGARERRQARNALDAFGPTRRCRCAPPTAASSGRRRWRGSCSLPTTPAMVSNSVNRCSTGCRRRRWSMPPAARRSR